MSPEQRRPASHEREPMLEVWVYYSQVPDQLADRFDVEIFIDEGMGALVRSNAALYALRAMLNELERQNLLSPSDAEGPST